MDERRPSPRVIYDEWAYHGDEGERMALESVMCREGIDEAIAREKYDLLEDVER